MLSPIPGTQMLDNKYDFGDSWNHGFNAKCPKCKKIYYISSGHYTQQLLKDYRYDIIAEKYLIICNECSEKNGKRTMG